MYDGVKMMEHTKVHIKIIIHRFKRFNEYYNLFYAWNYRLFSIKKNIIMRFFL